MTQGRRWNTSYSRELNEWEMDPGVMDVGSMTLVRKTGIDILHNPLYNKGTAFPMEERDRLGLRGLLPPNAGVRTTMEWQIRRILNIYETLLTPLNRYQFLKGLQDRNETLFYRILLENIGRLAPIVYTPTVGEACQQFGNIFRRPRGMYFSMHDKRNMAAMVYNWPEDDVKLIVVTDGSRILGLGDLGVNGMGIPIGKLALYVAAAGILPSKVLPVMIDVGTNNPELLHDDLYLGIRKPRIPGGSDEYLEIMDEFMAAVYQRWPNCLVQFEDFNNASALTVLRRYRYRYLCFNDDIQGTGSVVVGALLAAIRGFPEVYDPTTFKCVIVGAGSAGKGIARQIEFALRAITKKEASARIWMVDDRGLVTNDRDGIINPYARSDTDVLSDGTSLLDVVQKTQPDALIGVTGVAGLFTKQVVEAMAAYHTKPLIFPLSNPTKCAECTAAQAYEWTNGKAIFASGSPFDEVEWEGKHLIPNQANNMYSFPGLGMGALLAKARRISSGMLRAASIALSQSVRVNEIREKGVLFPSVDNIRSVSRDVAVHVIEQAIAEDIAQNASLPQSREALEAYVEKNMWYPKYGAVVKASHEHS